MLIYIFLDKDHEMCILIMLSPFGCFFLAMTNFISRKVCGK
jgi:hypothetical protein